MDIIGILSYITAIERINSFTTFLLFAGVTSIQQPHNIIFNVELIFLQLLEFEKNEAACVFD